MPEEELSEWQSMGRVDLNYSSLSLINATGEFPGDRDSVLFWLQLKGLPLFSLLVFIPLHFPTHPRESLLPKLHD